MQEMLMNLLQAVLVAATPIVTAYIVKLLNAKAEEAKEAMNNELASKYITEAKDAISTAVLFVEQKFTEELKESGNFSAANQIEALKMALFEARSLMSVEAKRFLEEVYGDLDNYLKSKIEAEVKLLK
ncbi:MAG: hypothetical protein FWH05_09660 [Oscillospiraceae bacterium]|nr:hypothetical protein [Oscillospiraceae bacterium]